MAESYPDESKTLWEKEKLLGTSGKRSNFSFSHSVFKRLEMQTRKNKGLFGKRLRKIANIVEKRENAGNQFVVKVDQYLQHYNMYDG